MPLSRARVRDAHARAESGRPPPCVHAHRAPLFATGGQRHGGCWQRARALPSHSSARCCAMGGSSRCASAHVHGLQRHPRAGLGPAIGAGAGRAVCVLRRGARLAAPCPAPRGRTALLTTRGVTPADFREHKELDLGDCVDHPTPSCGLPFVQNTTRPPLHERLLLATARRDIQNKYRWFKRAQRRGAQRPSRSRAGTMRAARR